MSSKRENTVKTAIWIGWLALVSFVLVATSYGQSTSRFVTVRGLNTQMGIVDETFASPDSAFDWFTYQPRYNNATGQFELAYPWGSPFDISSLAPDVSGGVTYYVGFPGAAGGATGLSRSASLTSLAAALGKADVSKVVLYGKTYVRSLAGFPSNWAPARDTVIVAEGAPAVLSRHENATWTLETGSTYKCTRASASWVWDAKQSLLSADGDFEKLTLRASIVEVDAAPGSYFIDGSTVYVRTSDSRNLIGDTDIRVFVDETNGIIQGTSQTVYFENIYFHGGTKAFQVFSGGVGITPTVYGKNCHFKYTEGENGFHCFGADTGLQDCVAAHNNQDGFNYHAHNTNLTNNWEVRCVGRYNGYTGAGNNNGSTMHDGMSVVRVGCEYHNNEGPNCVDIDLGTTWMVGCRAYNSRKATTGTDFYSGGSMWLDSCAAESPAGVPSDSVYELQPVAVTINLRKFWGPGQRYLLSSGGTFAYFE